MATRKRELFTPKIIRFFLLNFHFICKKIPNLSFEVIGVAAYTCSCECPLCDCLAILNPRSALLEKMPVMESKLSSEPVTNGEVPSQPEVQTKQGTMSHVIFVFVCQVRIQGP